MEGSGQYLWQPRIGRTHGPFRRSGAYQSRDSGRYGRRPEPSAPKGVRLHVLAQRSDLVHCDEARLWRYVRVILLGRYRRSRPIPRSPCSSGRHHRSEHADTARLLAYATRHDGQAQPQKSGCCWPRVDHSPSAARAEVRSPRRCPASVSARHIRIDSENGRYEVVYGTDVLPSAAIRIKSLGENTGLFLLCSPRVARHWQGKFERALRSAGLRRTIIFDDREKSKNIATVER